MGPSPIVPPHLQPRPRHVDDRCRKRGRPCPAVGRTGAAPTLAKLRPVAIAAAVIDNRNGALRADGALTVDSGGTLDNGGGLVSAAETVVVRDRAATKTLAIANAGGTFVAGERLAIDAASLGGDGNLLSHGDLALALVADFTNTGEITANRNASVDTAGTFTNAATLQAGAALALTAAAIDNRASGEILGTAVALNAGSLANRGLIDGNDTRIDVTATLANLGSGRIYGTQLAIAAATLVNAGEGGSAPTIAARDRLDLGVGSLANENDALVFSAGDMSIGGTLDAGAIPRATGSATLVRNHGATVEALGALAIAAADIRNTNAGLVTETVDEGSRLIQEVQPEGWAERHDVSYFPRIFDHELEAQPYVVDDVVRARFEDYTFYQYTATTTATRVVSSKPGQILAGGNATLTGTLENRDSRIVAGGTLAQSGGSLENFASEGTRTTRYSGWAQFRDWDGRDEELDFGPRVAFSPAPDTRSYNLDIVRYEGNADPGGSGTRLAALDVGSATRHADGRNGLFRPAPGADARYLIETDPRFASYRNWLSSDYMLAQLAIDPALTQKRLGDGFYEQRLVNEQVASLTGRRFLAGYANEEEQYKALMNAGIAWAKEWQLRPGVALSAAQMAQLTTDMVWLVEKEVAGQKVLVPQLYARVREGDLTPAGSLLSGERIDIAASGSVSNLGTIAGRQLVSLSADTIRNLGGSVRGEDIRLSAGRDIAMRGGTLDADRSLDLVAGRNIEIASSTRASEQREGGGDFSRSNIDRVAALYVRDAGGQMQIAATGDITLLAAHLINTAPTGAGAGLAGAGREKGEGGRVGGAGANAAAGANVVDGVDAAGGGVAATPVNQTRIAAGGNLTLGTVTIAEKNHTGGKGYSNHSGSRTEVGTRIASDGDVTLDAGATLAARAAEVGSEQGRILASGRDIVLEAGAASSYSDISQQQKRSGFLSSKTKSQRDSFESTTAVASTFSGENVTLVADRDIQVKGSNVVATHDTTLIAGRNLTVEAAQETHSESHEKKEKQSGFFSSGGASVTLGKRMNSSDQQTTATTAAASTVGSVEGNVLLLAGETYRQVGSDVVTPQGDIDIAAKRVEIVEARETSRTVTEQKSKQSGLTVAISNPVITAAQTAQQMAGAAKDTSDPRMKALAAASTALAGYNAYSAVTKAPDQIGGIGINVSIGSSKSKSTSTQTSDTAAVSNLTAGRDITITASGAGKDSDILLQGTNATAARNLTLAAEDEIRLLAARNTADQKSSNKSSSGSLGVGFNTASGFSVTASASRGSGKADGHDLGHSNTHVTAGETLTLQSGGDTTLRGAVARGERVVADIGGDLLIESLQDTSTYDSKQKNAGFSISVPITGGLPTSLDGFGGSVGGGNSKVKSDYRSVTEQSAIRAGDGGFDVRVEGDTDLRGGAITSTQKAIDDARNRFATGGELTLSDIHNKAEFEGKAISVNIGAGFSAKGELTPQGTSAGFGKTEGKAESMTLAAISGIAGNRDARTGDKETGIKPIFDQDRVQKEIDAQVRITQAFGQLASKAVGDFAQTKMNEARALRAQAEREADASRANALKAEAEALESQWGANGTLRLAAHTLIGGLTGGAEGALGAAAGTLTAPAVADALRNAGIDGALATAITGAASTAVGAAVGGTAGGGAALNEVANNYLSHVEIQRKGELQKAIAECKASGKVCASLQTELNELERIDRARDTVLDACLGVSSTTCNHARQEVRDFAAEIVKKGGADVILGSDGRHTIREATGTMSGGKLLFETGKGTLSSIADAYVDTLVTLWEAAKNPEGAAEALREQAQQAKEAVQWAAENPEKFKEIAQAAEQHLRDGLSEALKAGDEKQVGLLLGAVLANFTPDPAKKTQAALHLLDEIALAKKAETLAKRSDIDNVRNIPTGTKGNWSPDANGKLEPKTGYLLDNGHAYITDAQGRVKTVEADLNGLRMDRNGYQQGCVGKCGDAGDEGGHLIAAILGGAGDRINIVPQSQTLNRGEWRTMEKYLKQELDAGKNVTMKIEVGYPQGGGARPSEFTVVAYINGKPEPFNFKQ